MLKIEVWTKFVWLFDLFQIALRKVIFDQIWIQTCHQTRPITCEADMTGRHDSKIQQMFWHPVSHTNIVVSTMWLCDMTDCDMTVTTVTWLWCDCVTWLWCDCDMTVMWLLWLFPSGILIKPSPQCSIRNR